MKKYYTIDYTHLDDTELDLTDEIAKEHIYIYTGFMDKDALKKIGVIIQNKRYVPYSITYKDTKFSNDHDVITYLEEKYPIKFEEVTAEIDIEKLNDFYMKINNTVSVNEEIMDKNCKPDELLLKYLSGIGTKDHTLLITDDYFISKDNDERIFLESILKDERTKPKKIVVYTNKIPTDSKALIDSAIPITFEKNSEFHDRFWVCHETKKGFTIGGSPNGFKKKIMRIDYLKPCEVTKILDTLSY